MNFDIIKLRMGDSPQTVSNFFVHNHRTVLIDCSYNLTRTNQARNTIYIEQVGNIFDEALISMVHQSGCLLRPDQQTVIIVGLKGRATKKCLNAILSSRFVQGVLLNPPDCSSVAKELLVQMVMPLN